MQEELEREAEPRRRQQKGPIKRPHDVWTQAKADERALGLLIEMDLRDEGVREFLELSRLVLERDGKADEGVNG